MKFPVTPEVSRRTLLVAIAGMLAPLRRSGQHTAAREMGLNDIVRPYVDAGVFRGAVLVSRQDQILLRAAYGIADEGTQALNTPETAFQIASLTKPFTATLVMLLE